MEIIKDGAILIKNGRIIFVGKSASKPQAKPDVMINATGKVALPGLINCHTHVPMTLFRGIAEDKPLNIWLAETIWPLETKLKPDDVYSGALLGCLEMIKSGTTCFADMYFHENKVAEAVKESGLRGVLAEGIFDIGNEELGKKMLDTGVEYAKQFQGYSQDRVSFMLGPHAAYTCKSELLQRVREKASELNVGMHFHLAESKAMFSEYEKQYGAGEVEFLDNLGFFEGHVLAAHCIDLSKEDMRILSERHVNVAHAPVANMKIGLGPAKVKDLVDLGVNVGLGTDGPASNNTLDMFETMKVAALVQKLAYHDPTVMKAYEVLKMATLNGARALGLEKEIGSLEIGKKADLILVDFSKPHLKPLHNVYASIVYTARGSDVDTVIVDGKILMENRQVKTLNEHAAIESAEEVVVDLLSR
jgi:5-methylthioadenosine/S-adenosylhomocysteine deaminase